MRINSKSRKNENRNRDCTQCKYYGGFVSWNYYACTTYKSEEYPKDIEIYDRDVLKKGTCRNFVPIETELFQDWKNNDDLHDNNAMDSSKQKNDQSVPDQE